MKISMIAAIAENYTIGKDNHLPWHLPDDLKFFKDKTLNKPVVMGRKTYEAFGKPLPHRLNIVLTRDKNYQVAEGCKVVNSVREVLEFAESQDETMIIGGEEIYRLFLPKANVMYLTHIDQIFDGDTVFPQFNHENWKVVWNERHSADDRHQYSFEFKEYHRSV